MRFLPRPPWAGAVAALGLATIALAGGLSAVPASASPGPQFVALKNSAPATTDQRIGSYLRARMSIEVSLAPSHQAALASELRSAYTKGSAGYHHWLRRGQFDARYAPSAAERAAVTRYLRSQRLRVERSASPFLIRASGSSRQLETAFRTSLSRYRDPRGINYFANSSAVQLPARISSGVLGVVGLTNTVREHSAAIPAASTRAAGQASGDGSAGCETPYPTTAQLFAAVNSGTNIATGYGGSPGCSGLTPAQFNSIYNAPHVGPAAKGAGGTEAVFELS